jgi:hypothetical protein
VILIRKNVAFFTWQKTVEIGRFKAKCLRVPGTVVMSPKKTLRSVSKRVAIEKGVAAWFLGVNCLVH